MVTPQGPSRIPTPWRTPIPVSVEWMRQLRELPRGLVHGWINQFLYMAWLFDRIKNLEGDVVECGLGEGNTFAMLAFLIGTEGRQPLCTLYGFDSFEGWPEPTVWDASPRNPKKGEWLVTEDMVTRRFKESGLYAAFPALNIKIEKGFLGETLPKFQPNDGIVFAHLDVDLYPGYHDALMNLWPLVVPGGIVALDEFQEYHPELSEHEVAGYQVPKWPGCDTAVREFFAGRQEELRAPSKDNLEERGFVCNVSGLWYYAPTNKYFVVKAT